MRDTHAAFSADPPLRDDTRSAVGVVTQQVMAGIHSSPFGLQVEWIDPRTFAVIKDGQRIVYARREN